MNYRFKFRVWSKQSNSYIKEKMFYIDRFGGLFKYEKSKSTVYINAPSPYVMCLCGDNYIVEQCTALKDKNGKLIYEGDILRSESYPFKSDNEYHYAAEVCFDEESAVFFYYVFRTSTKVAGISEGNTGQINEYNWEIIGNIHENADLIKVGGK